MKKKNGIVSIIKFIYCIIIIVMHFGLPSTYGEYLFEGGYLYVDFFFVLQGFYLIKDWTFKEESAYQYSMKYMKGRIKRFGPCALFASLMMLFLQIFATNGFEEVVELGRAFLGQITFMSQFFSFLSLGRGGILWFLSASVICGTIAVFMCRLMGENFILLAMVIISILTNDLYASNGNLDTWYKVTGGNTVLTSLERAMVGILVGVVARCIARCMEKVKIRKWVRSVEVTILLLLIICSFMVTLFWAHSVIDFYMLWAFAIMLIFIYDLDVQNFKITDWFDELCMPMYIFQVCSFIIVSKIMTKDLFGCLAAIFVDFVFSICWIKFLSKINIGCIILEK